MNGRAQLNVQPNTDLTPVRASAFFRFARLNATRTERNIVLTKDFVPGDGIPPRKEAPPMIRSVTVAIAMALLSTAVSAQDVPPPAPTVATVTDVAGPVQINQGDQFLNLQTGHPVHPGDRIMALREGRAVLTFSDGCTLTVAPETMVVVPATSTCAGAVVTTQTVGGGSGAVGEYEGGVDWAGFWTVAGVAIVGNAILFAGDDDEDDDDTVSP
jgi:hypothetical protein